MARRVPRAALVFLLAAPTGGGADKQEVAQQRQARHDARATARAAIQQNATALNWLKAVDAARGVACSSGLSGDLSYETCVDFCRAVTTTHEGSATTAVVVTHITNHCAYCKCRTCSFWTPSLRKECEDKMKLKRSQGAAGKVLSTDQGPVTVHVHDKDHHQRSEATKKLDKWLADQGPVTVRVHDKDHHQRSEATKKLETL